MSRVPRALAVDLHPERLSSCGMHASRLSALAIALVSVTALTGCSVSLLPQGGSSAQPARRGLPALATPGRYQAPAPAHGGGTITVGSFQFPSTLSPYLGSQASAVPILQGIDDGLLGSGPDLGWYGDLAREVPTVENGGVRPA